jgi:hypothetical protein
MYAGEVGPKANITLRCTVIDGRPRFAKPPIDDGKQVKIAAIDPDFN